jgi:hypothetical protein
MATKKKTIKKKGAKKKATASPLHKRVSLGVTLKAGDDPKTYEFIRVDVANEADALPGETSDELLKRLGTIGFGDLEKVTISFSAKLPKLRKEAYNEMLE